MAVSTKAWLSLVLLAAPPVEQVERHEAPDPAADPELEISWTAPPQCPTREQLIAQTEALLARPLAQPGDPALELVGRIDVEGEGFVLRLDFRRPVARVRELRGSDCAELRDAAALVLAMTIDPLASLNELPDEEPPRPEEPAGEPAEDDPVDEAVDQAREPSDPGEPVDDEAGAAEETPERRELGGHLRLAGGVSLGPLPRVAGAPSLALGLSWRALRVELVGAYWLAADAVLDETPGVGARISLGWAAPRVCGVPSVSRVEFPLCGGIELGGMRGAAFGTSDARARTLAWVATQLGGGVSVELGRTVALWAGVDLVVPLTRPGFAIAGLGELHRSASVAFEACLGVEVHFVEAARAKERRRGERE